MTSKSPKISIITINYNNAEGLKKTIQSVISQDYKNIEYLVIDGNSNDGSKEIIKDFDSDISKAIIEPDTGIYNAMNKGTLLATGEYLLYLNSGDQLLNNNIISDVVNYGLDKDIVYGDLLFHQGDKEWKWHLPEKLSFYQFYNSTIAHPSTFIRRDLIKTLGYYDENLKIVADWKLLMLAIIKHQCTYKHIPLIISNYNFDGISSKKENFIKINQERARVLTQEFPQYITDYEELEKLKLERRKIRHYLHFKSFIKQIVGKK